MEQAAVKYAYREENLQLHTTFLGWAASYKLNCYPLLYDLCSLRLFVCCAHWILLYYQFRFLLCRLQVKANASKTLKH